METLARLLAEHGFLHGLGEADIELLVSCARNLRFDAGAFLLREGGPADTFYLLRSGKVSLETQVPGRGPTQLEQLGPDDMLGISWLVWPYRSHLDARALEPVVALAFDGACLRGKMNQHPQLGYSLAMRVLQKAALRLERSRLARLDLYREG